MSIYQCEGCGKHDFGSFKKCDKCMRKTKGCKHPSDSITGRWQYQGSKLISASGFCLDCGEPHLFCVKADKLVPKKKVKQPLPCVACGK